MTDVIEMHEALRWSGFGPDAPFHATDSSHELKVLKLLEELGDTPAAAEQIEELKSEVSYLESRIRELESDLGDARQEAEDERADSRHEINRLMALLSASGKEAAQ